MKTLKFFLLFFIVILLISIFYQRKESSNRAEELKSLKNMKIIVDDGKNKDLEVDITKKEGFE